MLNPNKENKFFFSLNPPDRSLGPQSLLFYVYQGHYIREKGSRHVKMST